MALTNPVPPNRSKIDMKDEKQVKAWSKRLGISPADLTKIVASVGNGLTAVQKVLERLKAASTEQTKQTSPLDKKPQPNG